MLRIVLLTTALLGCEVGGDTDQTTLLSTSDYPPNGSEKGVSPPTVRAPVPQIKRGTSDTSTSSGTYNTGRSTTATYAKQRTQPNSVGP
jgi:hypothetical protein